MLQVCFFKVVLLCTIGVGGGELSSTSDKLGDLRSYFTSNAREILLLCSYLGAWLLTCDLPSVSVLSWVVGVASVARATVSEGMGGVRLCNLFGFGGGVWRWFPVFMSLPGLSLGA